MYLIKGTEPMEIEQDHSMKILERLIGAWVGDGAGEYPTIEPFQFREALTFTPAEGKAYLHYDQRTWRKDKNGVEMPSHWESGFLRALADGEVEFLVAQGSGMVEISHGLLTSTNDGFILVLSSSLLANDARVEETLREFELHGSSLRVEMQMKTTAVPALRVHVQADLRRGG